MDKPLPDAQQAAAAGGGELATLPKRPEDLPYFGTPPLMHTGIVLVSVLAPIGLLAPPRNFGIRQLFLAGATFFATSQLTYDYTGQSIYQRFQSRLNQYSRMTSDLPESARLRQAAMNAERERRKREAEAAKMAAATAAVADPNTDKEKTTLEKIWMGKEKEDWAYTRAKHEKEMIDSGEGIWGLITEQVGDVLSDLFGSKKGGDGGESSTQEPTATDAASPAEKPAEKPAGSR